MKTLLIFNHNSFCLVVNLLPFNLMALYFLALYFLEINEDVPDENVYLKMLKFATILSYSSYFE